MQNYNRNKKIGGEFSIEISQFNGYSEFSTDQSIFLSGRSALAYILKSIASSSSTTKSIHIPYYICESVVNTIQYHGYSCKYYNLDANYKFDLNYLDNIRNEETLLLVNYFGFTPNNEILATIQTQRPDVITINDDVHSFWTYNESIADYSFTSLRKHFPVVAGGLVSSKKNLGIPHDLNESHSFIYLKLLGATLKGLDISDEDYLKILSEAEDLLNANYEPNLAPMLVSFLFSKVDLETAKIKRSENYRTVYELGEQIGLPFMFEYNSYIVPMNIPLLVPNKSKILKELRNNQVYLPSYWPLGAFQPSSDLAKKTSSEQVSIIIDQRYAKPDIIKQLELINDHI